MVIYYNIRGSLMNPDTNERFPVRMKGMVCAENPAKAYEAINDYYDKGKLSPESIKFDIQDTGMVIEDECEYL